MNSQPYQTPPRFWAPKLTPLVLPLLSAHARPRPQPQSDCRKSNLRNVDHLARAIDNSHGVLITPNHSFHFDSYCLLRASDQLTTPFYIMTVLAGIRYLDALATMGSCKRTVASA
ncbi:1-acyl-sn-glycerol-3-phosphate acyltransferase [Biomphalaria pfeifferi]|uniref:1-acyl-sn-glycerol-3-phosphate acyltransferase n=1 Tax=Biomphalaria pfeifferi TaxID=112525 RepID=A0AAD8AMK4_BIOPF|nr:1-acyl-sn-glycerol-3-phosphate acyltransferase [Biomphalaria pfeifferi]